MIEVSQRSDGTVRYLNPIDLNADMILGGQAVPDGGTNVRYLSDNVVKITLQAVAGNGGVAAWQNPFNYAVNVIGTIVDVIGTVAAQTVSVGTAATAATSSNNLVNAGSIASAALVGSRTNLVKLPIGNWVTATASGTPTGLSGCLYIEFFPAT